MIGSIVWEFHSFAIAVLNVGSARELLQGLMELKPLSFKQQIMFPVVSYMENVIHSNVVFHHNNPLLIFNL